MNLIHLTNRKILKVFGKDAFSYVQKLTTNNLQQKFSCLNSLFINPDARILSDFLIYKIKGDVFDKELKLNGLTYENYGKKYLSIYEDLKNQKLVNNQLTDDFFEIDQKVFNEKNENDEEILYLECDDQLADSVRKTFFVNRIHENVDFEILKNHQIYALCPDDPKKNIKISDPIYDQEHISPDFCFVNDPRLNNFSFKRIIINSEKLNSKTLKNLNKIIIPSNPDIKKQKLNEYKKIRYILGVGEGLEDHFMNEIRPLEFNADYLNALDNSYLEQRERLNYYLGSTTLIRQKKRQFTKLRLLPFEFEDSSLNIAPPAKTVFLKNKEIVGYCIKNIHSYGIGYFNLLKVKIFKDDKIDVDLFFNDKYYKAFVNKPFFIN